MKVVKVVKKRKKREILQKLIYLLSFKNIISQDGFEFAYTIDTRADSQGAYTTHQREQHAMV